MLAILELVLTGLGIFVLYFIRNIVSVLVGISVRRLAEEAVG